MTERLAIGSAQFGLDYGISNESGIVPVNHVGAILNWGMLEGVRTIDTAKAYGSSEFTLGQFDLFGFDIITKISDFEAINEAVDDSLQKLKVPQLYGLLAHDFSYLERDVDRFDALKAMRENEKVKKIGFSINKLSDLEFLFENDLDFDLIQLPYNLFDRRFEDHFQMLESKGIEIHVRSVFLQGLFFLSPDKLPDYLSPLATKLRELEELSVDNGLSKLILSLNYVLSNPYISKVIIGVTNLSEFEENLNATRKLEEVQHVKSQLDLLRHDDEDYVLPMNWK